MNKRLNIIIYILLAVMAILLLWVIFFRKGKEIIFNIPNNIEVKVGSNYSIEYELNSELDVIWGSENNNIVTVNNGIINGIRHSREQYRHVLDAYERYNNIISDVGTPLDEYFRSVQENGNAIKRHYEDHKDTNELYF